MALAWGIILAVGVMLFGRATRFDGDRAFYPTILVVVASYYLLFAVMGGDRSDLVAEAIGFVLFAGAAVAGFRTSLWVAAAGLAAHGVFDFFHAALVTNDGLPGWWPEFCMGYDVAAALCLAGLLRWSPPRKS